MTQDERIKAQQNCEELWYESNIYWNGNVYCDSYRKIETPVMKCIKEYTRGITEKYDDPNYVTNLREDEYSNVVKTCNEIFKKWTQ